MTAATKNRHAHVTRGEWASAYRWARQSRNGQGRGFADALRFAGLDALTDRDAADPLEVARHRRAIRPVVMPAVLDLFPGMKPGTIMEWNR